MGGGAVDDEAPHQRAAGASDPKPGLGLAIARIGVQAHGASPTLANCREDGWRERTEARAWLGDGGGAAVSEGSHSAGCGAKPASFRRRGRRKSMMAKTTTPTPVSGSSTQTAAPITRIALGTRNSRG